MGRPLTPLGSLGQRVAAALENDGGARARALESARQAFVEGAVLGPDSRRRSPVWPAPLLAVAAIAIAMGVAYSGQPEPLTFNVNGKPGVEQTWLAAPSQGPLAVGFSDGTVLDIDAQSRARVAKTTPEGADIALENGSLHARVVHKKASSWRVTAGPFAVRVTGTRFDLSWVASTQTFSLDVREGSVVVSGAMVGFERPVRAGEKLVASVGHGRFEVLTTAAAEQARSSSPQGPATDDSQAEHRAPSAASAKPEVLSSSPRAERQPAAPHDWKELARRGELKAAFSAAESAGFRGVCDSASSSELLLLGDAARLSSRPDRANEALLTLRRRYPSDPRRAAAAFALGKVAFDQQRSYAQAAQWFKTSMQEAPNGPLAREAAGRRIEAFRSAGDTGAMKEAARDYLTRYPEGPHAAVARALLVQ